MTHRDFIRQAAEDIADLIESKLRERQLVPQQSGLPTAIVRFLEDLDRNYDCDTGAGRLHSDHCRACEARNLLKSFETPAHEPTP